MGNLLSRTTLGYSGITDKNIRKHIHKKIIQIIKLRGGEAVENKTWRGAWHWALAATNWFQILE